MRGLCGKQSLLCRVKRSLNRLPDDARTRAASGSSWLVRSAGPRLLAARPLEPRNPERSVLRRSALRARRARVAHAGAVQQPRASLVRQGDDRAGNSRPGRQFVGLAHFPLDRRDACPVRRHARRMVRNAQQVCHDHVGRPPCDGIPPLRPCAHRHARHLHDCGAGNGILAAGWSHARTGDRPMEAGAGGRRARSRDGEQVECSTHRRGSGPRLPRAALEGRPQAPRPVAPRHAGAGNYPC